MMGQKNEHAIFIDRETELDILSDGHRQCMGPTTDEFIHSFLRLL